MAKKYMQPVNRDDEAPTSSAAATKRSSRADLDTSDDPINTLQRLYTLREAAVYLRNSVKTVRRMIQAGEIPFVRVRKSLRIRQDDLEAFTEVQRNGVKGRKRSH